MKLIFLCLGLLLGSLLAEEITEIEPNNSYDAVTSLDMTDKTFTGEISDWGDIDWWWFTANEGDVIQIVPAETYDVGVWLYTHMGDQGAQLGSNTPGFGTLEYTVTETGVYRVQVAPYNNFTAYSYSLEGSSAGSGATPPEISGMRDYLLPVGTEFPQLNMDDFVYDSIYGDEEIIWSTEDNTHITVEFDENRVASFTTEEGWSGTESIKFIAENPDGAIGNVVVQYSVVEPIVSLEEDFNSLDPYSTINLPDMWFGYNGVYANETFAYQGMCVKLAGSETDGPSYLITPLVQNNGGVDFSMKARRGNIGPVEFEIGLMTDVYDLSTYQSVQSYTTDVTEYADFDLNISFDSLFHIVIKLTSELNYFDLYIDDVTIEANSVVSLNEDFTPKSAEIIGNYPNPFNPTTDINYVVNSNSDVEISIFNAKGEFVQNLVNGTVNAGSHTISFDGSKLNSGVYYSKLTVDGAVSSVSKMVLVK